MQRYSKLLDLIRLFEPRTIVEVGTWNGQNAIRMIREASKQQEQIHYVGYDLFEEATAETDRQEFNVKPHNNIHDVEAEIKKACPDVDVALIKGNTRETLSSVTADFVFIDGGHSVETIKSDYEALKGSQVIVLDDYYTPDEEGKMPDISKVGCNSLVNSLPHAIIETPDRVSGGGFVHLAVVFGG